MTKAQGASHGERALRRRSFLAVSGCTVALAACTNEPYRRLSEVAPPSGAGLADYRLGSGDTIRVTVFGQPDLSGEFPIDASGEFPMPLLGPMGVADQTAREVEKDLKKRLVESGYVVDPQIGV